MRTKIYFLAVLLCSIASFSQIATQQQQAPVLSGDPTNQINELQAIFTNLEKERIPTGFLLDAGVEFANLKKYDGTIPDSSHTSSKLVLDVYNTLLMSRLSANAHVPKTSEQFSNDWKSEQSIDIIPLGGVFFKYAQFSEVTQQNAQNTGDPGTLTVTDGKLYDKYINGVWQNPYEEKQIFALTPALSSFNKFNFKIKLPNSLFLSNQSSQILKIEYKLSDNQSYQLLPYNQLIDVNYSAEGTYHWTFKLTLNSGQVLYSHTQFIIDGHLDQYTDITDVASKSNLGQYSKQTISIGSSKATLYIKLAPGHTQITKPLIVAEGFDMGAIITPSREAGLTNIDGFIRSLTYENYDSTLRYYLSSNYDIIYVDWNNGVDYIQNNAALLVEAIQWVNANKSSTEKNVVLGQSMGGLVARFALKDMEDNGLVHDTKLFISHDSPHLGANIPAGLQYMLINISKTYVKSPILVGLGELVLPIFNQGISVSDILTLTATPAARQMLINYVNYNYVMDNSIHNNWQNQLKTKGYPKLTRNVAISNGSECGTDQNLQDLLTLYKETGQQHLFSDIIGVLVGVATWRLDMIVLAALPGSSKYVFDFNVKPMTNINENKQVYKGNIKYKKKILWFINAQVSLLSGSRNQPTNVLPIDKYGGGKFILAENELPSFLKDNLSTTPFSFIPTPSAIDYKLGNTSLGENEYQRAYSPVDDKLDVPFANFVAEKMDANNTHISFSPRNGQFIINQLSNFTSTQNEPITTAYLCGSKVNIGGNTLLCSNDTVTYTTGFAPTIQWSILNGSNLIDITGPINQPQISFTPKPNANGFVKLQAYLAGDGANNTVTKNVWIGKPIIYFYQNIEDDPTHAYIGSAVSGATLADQGLSPSQVTWRRLHGTFTKSGYSFLITTTIPEFDVEIKATNDCGTTTLQETVIYSPICNNYNIVKTSEDNYDIIDPCPPGNPTQSTLKMDDITIIVVDINGREVVHTKDLHFSLQSQLPGLYISRIIKNGQIVHSQNLIKN